MLKHNPEVGWPRFNVLQLIDLHYSTGFQPRQESAIAAPQAEGESSCFVVFVASFRCYFFFALLFLWPLTSNLLTFGL
jgi:hypothetical protein